MRNRIGVAGLAVALACSVMPVMAQSGGDTYKSKCAMCHGADGSGNKGMKVASFKSPEMAGLSEAAMISATKNGKGRMPAYAGKLTDAQIKAVVAHVRTLQK